MNRYATLFICLLVLLGCAGAPTRRDRVKRGGPCVPFNALHDACAKGQVERAVSILSQAPDLMNEPDCIRGNTPLAWAALGGHRKTVEMLMRSRAITETTNFAGNSPLMIAAGNGHLEVVAALVAAGADVNFKGAREVTALHMAAAGGHSQVAALLVEQGAVVNSPDTFGMTPIDWAAQLGHQELTEFLRLAASYQME